MITKVFFKGKKKLKQSGGLVKCRQWSSSGTTMVAISFNSTRLQFVNIKFIAKASTLFWCTIPEYFPGSSFDILGKAEQVIAHRGKN